MLINGKTEIVKIGCEMVTIDGFRATPTVANSWISLTASTRRLRTSSATTATIRSATNLG